MKYRIQLKRPDYSHRFEIHHGTATKAFSWWEFYPDWEALHQLTEFDQEIQAHPKLDEILRLVGSHATLWIGSWQGTLSPMDVQPQGWTYPSGKPIEPEWFWQWHPVEHVAQAAVTLLNADPISAWEATETTPLKAGVPSQMQRALGEVQAVDAIPVQRLPDLMRKDATLDL